MNKPQEKIDQDLQFGNNPRTITDSKKEQLSNHLEKFGDLGGVIYCQNNKAYVGGNQRSKIFDGAIITILDVYDKPLQDKTVAVGFIEWKGNKYLYREVRFSQEEFKEACVVANSDGGEWDFDKLASGEWDGELLSSCNIVLPESLDKLYKVQNTYTRKIETPVYTPSEEAPVLSDLFDQSKTKELTEQILASDIPDDIKKFLLMASKRHIIFNYEKIADYYAHADKRVQELMEDSALVIIDFDKAIEQGYVKLAEEIKEQYLSEYGE